MRILSDKTNVSIFSQACLFIFLIVVFEEEKILNFNEVHLINSFSFTVIDFCVLSKVFANPRTQ